MSNTLNHYNGLTPTVAITAGTQLAVAVVFTKGGDGTTPTTATLNGVAGTLVGATAYTGGDESNIAFFEFTTIPAAGNYALALSGGSVEQVLTALYEFNDRSGVLAASLHSQDFGNQATSPYTANYSRSSVTGSPLLVAANGVDDNLLGVTAAPTIPAALDEISGGTYVDRIQCASGVDASVAASPQAYSFAFTDAGMGGGSQGRITVASVVLVDIVNVDPELDSPVPDIAISAGDIDSVDLSTYFSDANPGDTLTFSIDPPLPNGVTLSSAGLLAWDGTQVETATANFTITADDGNGGTAATDVFALEIGPPVITINSTTDIVYGEPFTITTNALVDLTAAVSITAIYGGISLTGLANVTASTVDFTAPSGGLELDAEHELILVVDADVTAGFLKLYNPPAGKQVVTLTSVSPNSRLNKPAYNANPGGAANNVGVDDEIVIAEVSTPGNYPLVLNPDGTITLTGAEFETVNQTADWFYLDAQDGYGASNTQILTLGAPALDTAVPVITLIGANPLTWVQGIAWTDPGATVSDNVDTIPNITADNIPNIAVPGSYTLNYNVDDAAGNSATQVTRTVNVVAADTYPDAITFQNVANAALNTVYNNIQFIAGVDTGQPLTAIGGFEFSNDGVAWSSSGTMAATLSRVRATIDTTGAVNGQILTQSGSVNGRAVSFTVTVIAAVTRSFVIGSSNPVVDIDGAMVTHTYPIWQLWDKIPEDPTAVIVDSGINLAITAGLGSISSSLAAATTNYLLIARDAGNNPANYFRVWGQLS